MARKNRADRPASRGTLHDRAWVAAEAARILADEGMRDYQLAKRKAAERLGLGPHPQLPGNDEVEHALREHMTLFHGAALAARVAQWRRIARDAMTLLAPFAPRLVGATLSGLVTPQSDIELHLQADTPEQVAMFLLERHIPFEPGGRKIRYGGNRVVDVPTYEFAMEGVDIELVIFDTTSVRETPLSPVDGRVMQRASMAQLDAMLRDGTTGA
jgi:hypothetical protein